MLGLVSDGRPPPRPFFIISAFSIAGVSLRAGDRPAGRGGPVGGIMPESPPALSRFFLDGGGGRPQDRHDLAGAARAPAPGSVGSTATGRARSRGRRSR